MSKRSKRNIIMYGLMITLCATTVAYAALQTVLTISGTVVKKGGTWDIHFENISTPTLTGNATMTTPSLSEGANLTFSTTLVKPLDKAVFTVDVVNDGSINAELSELVMSGAVEAYKKDIRYFVTYNDGTPIKQGDLLLKEETKKLKVEISYNDVSSLEASDVTLNFGLTMIYTQTDKTTPTIDSPIISLGYKCMRATEGTLHTETCEHTASDLNAGGCLNAGFTTGQTITYGQVGTAGALASGDAFDCDVNGDGEYNPLSERFYYVTDLEDNSNVAVLIYYSNTIVGLDDFTSASNIAYNISDEAYLGPVTAATNLPTINQWGNVSLTNIERQITNPTGGTTASIVDWSNGGDTVATVEISKFTYKNSSDIAYASRLITTQELERAGCATRGSYDTSGKIQNCLYLGELTQFSSPNIGSTGYWMETLPDSGYLTGGKYSAEPYAVVGIDNHIGAGSLMANSAWYGVRPVIEVAKTDIAY